MFERAISEDTKKSLDLVKSLEAVKRAYLAGGTGLALQLGHRVSFDLDFFSDQKFDSKIFLQDLAAVGDFRLESTSWQTITGTLNGVKFSYFYYQYPLIEPTVAFEGVALASVADIAAMKIAAIADRGTKRDFIDLYFILKEKVWQISELLAFYEKKYKTLEANRVHLQKSLVYFEDAEADPNPQMIKEVDWPAVKSFITREATAGF